MGLTISTLADIPEEQIISTFNGAFQNYFIPVDLTPVAYKIKSATEDLRLDLSAGAFVDGELVGFLLRSCRVVDGIPTTYNGGTGVLERFRGQRIVSAMYQYGRPVLQKEGVRKEILEVIVENAPAIKAYKREGFHLLRKVQCYKGIPKEARLPKKYEWGKMSMTDLGRFQDDWDCNPTWQYALKSIENLATRHVFRGVFHAGDLVGAMVFAPFSNKILHLFVRNNHRNKGIASALVFHAYESTQEPISVINVDATQPSALCNLFEKMGLSPTLSQYEMALDLPKF